MTYGARSYGTRTYGDGTGDSGAGGAPPQSGAVVFAGALTATFAGQQAQQSTVLFAGVGTALFDGVEQAQARIKFVARSDALFRVPVVKTVDPSEGREPYRIIVTDAQGNRYGEVEASRMGNLTWVLNGIGAFDFTTAVKDAKALLPTVPKREVQVWRGRQQLWTGPVVRKNSDKASVTAQAQTLEWYFTRRHVGKANRTNYMINPSFENGLSAWDWGWDPVALPEQVFPFAHGEAKSPVYVGERSAKIHMTQANPATALSQTILWSVPLDLTTGELWTAVAWFYIENWVGPAHANRGMDLSRYSTTETIPIYTPIVGAVVDYPKPLGGGQITFDSDTPRGTWVRAEIPLNQPPRAGSVEFVKITLSGIQGTIYWDQVSLTRDEALWFNNVDQATIVKTLVEHSQDPAYGKSDLNIGTDCPLTGVKRTRKYAHHDHQMISDALLEFPSLANGLDISVEPGPVERTFTSHFPYKGYRRNDIVLEYGRNIVDYTVVEDGERTSNSVVVLGDGEGSDREEGGFIDPDSLDGLILEKVYNSTPGAPIQTLGDQAKRGVERYKRTVVIPSITTHEGAGDLIGNLRTGDVVRVKVQHGSIDVNDWYRIIQISLDPNTDQMVLTINPLTEEVLAL